MSAHTKIAKSLQVGSYAPVVFQPSPTGEHIQRAVETLQLTGVTICGETVNANEPPAPKPQPKLPSTFISVHQVDGIWYVDWVSPLDIQALYSSHSIQAARAYANRKALRLGLIVHQGPYVWEAAA